MVPTFRPPPRRHAARGRLASLLALALWLAACGGSAPAASDGNSSGAAVPAFVVEDAPTWRAEGVRIATFNGEFLFDGEGDEGSATFPWKGDPEKAREHRAHVGAVVRTLDADLVLMPETENLNALQLLADETLAGMGYTAHLVDGRDSFTGQDVGLLSRIPIDTLGRVDTQLPVGLTDRLYGVSKNLFARTTIGGTPTTLVGVHFLARPDDPERKDRRETQAEVIRQFVASEIAAGRAVIALGDFNDIDDAVLDRRGSRPITDVLARVKSAGPGDDDDLVNVLGDVPQAERFTSFYDRNGDERFDEGEFSAIDHLLLSPELYRRVREVRYVHSFDPREVSDHFPIVVTVGAE